jgi:hypothetical protein
MVAILSNNYTVLSERRRRQHAFELVRRAVQLLRERESLELQPFAEVLRRTRGLWRAGDGLEHQTTLRDEW